ncbi:ribokinase [Acidobacteria bacterium AB60]|nr:ribokinase [Acidobacteria bacterium AB60]
MPKPIVVIGSINMDLVARTPRIPLAGETLTGSAFDTTSGGKGANQAVAIARLGHPVAMLGALGNDVFGDALLKSLKAEGVDTSGISRIPGPSGVAQIQVADNGQNSIVVVPGANAKVDTTLLDQQKALIASAGMVLLQLEIPRDTVLHAIDLCAAARVPVMLDPAPAAPLPESLWSRIAWFTPNETEAPVYVSAKLTVKDAAQQLIARGLKGVVLKRGAEGALVAARDGRAKWLPAFKVKAIDSVGAGDCFNGALAVALMEGQDPIVAAHFASAAAALSVTRRGAQASMPTRAELDRFLDTHSL